MRQGDAGRAVEHSPGLAEAAAVAGAEEPAAGFAGFGLDEASLVGADAGDGKDRLDGEAGDKEQIARTQEQEKIPLALRFAFRPL